MDSVSSAMLKIMERCDICINNNIISKELLMRAFSRFISSTIEKDKHNVGIVLHTGSKCFDALMLSYAALSDILYNDTDPEELLHSLEQGEMVVYKKQRYVFQGFVKDIKGSLSSLPITDDGNYVLLKQESSFTAVPRKKWGGITPYMGNSKRLDGRGIRKESGKRKDFFVTVLDMAESDIPSTIDASTIVVMPRDESAELIQGLSFRYGDNEIKYTELVTASYFTESNQEYPYGSNVAKVEPVIKVTSKVSVARKLLLKRDWNRNIGLVLLGEESIRRGYSELPELIERQSIQYVYLCTHIDSENSSIFLQNYADANLFACTKDFLLSNTKELVEENKYTKQLNDQIDAIIDHEIQTVHLEKIIEWEEYKSFKQSMFAIKASDYDSEKKDSFVIQSFALMNLFMTAPFPLMRLEDAISSGAITNVESPIERIQYLTSILHSFPEHLIPYARSVTDILESTYLKVYDNNDKSIYLRKALFDRKNQKLCVIVPKAYYISVLTVMYPSMKNVSFVTANKFNNEKLYDTIICVGNLDGRKFNIFRCRSSEILIVMLYEAEQYLYRKKSRLAARAEHYLNSRSTIETEDDYYEETFNEEEDAEVDEIEAIDNAVYEFVGSVAARSARSYFGGGEKNGVTDIVAIAKFDSGEVAFFTKNYKAYILDEVGQTAREAKVEELAEGDTIIFTRSTAKTRDIVDGILQEMVIRNKLPAHLIQAYNKSKVWKTSLIEYMKANNLTPTTIAKKMINNGVSVQEATIKRWLDEDAHTVGPRELSSLQQIAVLTKNVELLDTAEDIYRACAEVRSVRRRILDAIGTAILKKITGKQIKEDSVLSTVSEQIDDLGVVLQIDNISFEEETVPVNLINRPVSVGIE